MQNNYLGKISQALQQIAQAPELYRHRLVVIVMPTEPRQTLSLSKLAEQLRFQYININLELSQLLLEVPKNKQPLEAVKLLNDEIIEQSAYQGLVLDYLEILFEPFLKLDPMRCLLDISRRYTVVARWSGLCEKGYLVHAEPGHPEYGRYQTKDIVIISVESNP